MRLRLFGTITGAAALLGCVAMGTPAHAADNDTDRGVKMRTSAEFAIAAAPGTGRGYAWNHTPSAPLNTWYSLAGGYAYNSNSTVLMANRYGIGTYTVWFPGIGAAGNVQVTAYGEGDVKCKVGSWRAAPGNGTDIDVRCFDRYGQLTDSTYTVSYNYLGSDVKGGYLWADQPTAASYTPSPGYQGGASSTIDRSGTGVYTAKFAGLGAVGGHVQVTAYGGSSDWCKSGGWGPAGGTQYVTVLCYTASGAPVDTYFSLSYVTNGSVLWGTPAQSAYAWADQPATDGYSPSSTYAYDANPWAGTWINRLSTGRYGAHLATDLNRGLVHVTGYGWDNTSCKVAWWNSTDGARVNCFHPDGTPADARYDVAAVALP
jgi:hypothetical protein